MSTAKSFILATAGHVDHGKTALVRALSGTDTDRLPAEKARGMTIELGFAHVNLQRGDEPIDVGLVDVPGHESFVRNMVAGVGSIDAALLVVAADDGWMPQTEEHLQILTYCGVRRAVVALNKADLAADLSASVAAVRQRLVGTIFASAPVVATSTLTGAGIDALREALLELFATMPPRDDHGKPRLAVDRVFSLKGLGTVVTGTLSGGRLRRGDAVTVHPRGDATRIRALQTHGRDREEAEPGTRVALNLPDLHAGESAHPFVARGDTVASAGTGRLSRQFDVVVEPNYRQGDAPPTRLPRSGGRIMLHHATAVRLARLKWLDARNCARITVEVPLLLCAFDRLVIRSSSQQQTLAGATVLDPAPPPLGRKMSSLRAAQDELLWTRSEPGGDLAAFVVSQVSRDGAAAVGTLASMLEASACELDAAMDAVVAGGTVTRFDDVLCSRPRWTQALAEAGQAIDAHHARHPEQRGIAIAELAPIAARVARRTPTAAPAAALLPLLADALCRGGFGRTAGVMHRAAHRPALPERLRQAGEQIRQVLSNQPFDPPSRKELSRTDVQLQALKYLIAAHEVIEIGVDVVLSAEAYARAIVFIQSHLRTATSATVSELKAAVGSSRRIMVPLLERLDREHITQRIGDRRVLPTVAAKEAEGCVDSNGP